MTPTVTPTDPERRGKLDTLKTRFGVETRYTDGY